MNTTEPEPGADHADPADQADRGSSSAALLRVLRRRLDRPDLDYAEPPIPLSGGFWAEIFALRLVGAPPELSGELVARIMPDDLAGRRETVIQREVAAQGFPAPVIRLSGDASDGLGRAYMLMDRSAGTPLLSGLEGPGAALALPRLLRRLPKLLASTALRLHLLDPDPVIAALDREVPDAFYDVAGMVAHLHEVALLIDHEVLIEVTTWLAEHRPEPERVSVCHGDLHPFNLLVAGEGADEEVTVIDWTVSRIAEPAFDLAFTTLVIRYVPVELPGPLTPIVRKLTERLAARVLREYRRIAAPHGIAVDDDRLDYYLALMGARALTEVETWAAAGELADHPGHPFVEMRATLTAQIRSITNV